jgi:carbon starvation protein CstA
MNAIVLVFTALLLFAIAYRFYSLFIVNLPAPRFTTLFHPTRQHQA